MEKKMATITPLHAAISKAINSGFDWNFWEKNMKIECNWWKCDEKEDNVKKNWELFFKAFLDALEEKDIFPLTRIFFRKGQIPIKFSTTGGMWMSDWKSNPHTCSKNMYEKLFSGQKDIYSLKELCEKCEKFFIKNPKEL